MSKVYKFYLPKGLVLNGETFYASSDICKQLQIDEISEVKKHCKDYLDAQEMDVEININNKHTQDLIYSSLYWLPESDVTKMSLEQNTVFGRKFYEYFVKYCVDIV